MISTYTSRLPGQFARSETSVLQNLGDISPVYHAPGDFLVGILERRRDGVYFVPYLKNIGGARFNVSGTDHTLKNVRKLRPGLELEVMDFDNFPIGAVRVSEDIPTRHEESHLRWGNLGHMFKVASFYLHKKFRLVRRQIS
jgi:hypothetical protein